MTAQAQGIEGASKPQIPQEQVAIIKLDTPRTAGVGTSPKGGLLRRLESQLGSIT